jgi:hypothetical protein
VEKVTASQEMDSGMGGYGDGETSSKNERQADRMQKGDASIRVRSRELNLI